MSVSISDIQSLKDKTVYETSDETIVLKRDFNKIIHSPQYIILGFLNGYMYTSRGTYIAKSTLDGNEIAEIRLEVEHGTFFEGVHYFYLWDENIIYRLNESLEIDWEIEIEDEIQSVVMDIREDLYVLTKNSRDIRKYLSDGTLLMYISGSDDPTKDIRLYNVFVSKGAGWLYVIGTEFWDYNNKAQSFIDKYDTRTWDKIERQIITYGENIEIDDLQYAYDKFYVKGDYIYIYAMQYISKINIKAIEMWRYIAGYNSATGTFDQIGHIEYDDNPFNEYLYFVEDLYSSNGHSFGKMGLNGSTIWQITMTDSADEIDFNIDIYQDKIYTTNRAMIETKKGYVLSLDDKQVLFRARAGHLIEIIDFNSDEIYSPDNYEGMYLLASTIKEGIPKIVYHPLRHDDGDVVEEFGNVLLLPEENFGYTDLDNYDYKYLLCSNYAIDANDFSIIFAKNYKPVYTKLKNVIKTKQPYLPDRMYEYILSMPGDRIDTMQDKDIIRSRWKWSYDRYLLADRNMFFTEIITKDLELTIITKDKGYIIIRKQRDIYTYILCRYDDINLIEEWLKENGVMDTMLPDLVADLIHHTMNSVRGIQIAGTPTIYDLHSYKQHEYMFDGTEYYNNTWGTQIFSCTNLPYDKRKCFKKVYIDSLVNIIKRQEMRPILLFLNGKAIKWSDVTVVRDLNYSYLLINNTNPYETELSCIMFPCDIRYGEDNDCLDDDICSTYFYFDEDGLLTEDKSKVALRIEIIDQNIIGGTFTYDKKYIEVENEWYQRASERNIHVFESSVYFPDSRYYIQDHSKDIFTYLRPTENVIFKTFYWIKGWHYLGMLNKLPNQQLVKDKIIGEAVNNTPSGLDDFKPPFQYSISRKKSWTDNVAQAVRYIMQYDMSLLIKYYKQQSCMESYIYDGDYLINRVPVDGGWLIMPRHRRSKYDDFIIVFRNNHLYEYYKEIQYDTHNFKIPIFNHITRDDKIEILHFKEVDNSYYSLTIDPDVMDYLPEGLRYDNFLLFGNSPTGKQYYDEFSVESGVQYDIDFAYKNNFNGNKYVGTNIKLADSYYEGKKINVCSKRQFRHMYYNIFYDRTSVNLDPTFRFCHDENKFIIFKNWLLLTQDDWDLKYPTNESPSKYISIEFKDTLHEGDVIEIFYLPVSYDEIDISEDIINRSFYIETGDIDIDPNKLGYQYDKDLFMISIGGWKINPYYIQNINNHRLRITDINKIEESSNMPYPKSDSITGYLYRFIQPDQLLNKLYSYSDKWSDAVDGLTPQQYEQLLTKFTKD